MKIAGVILAGGLARRMGGGDKALMGIPVLASRSGFTAWGVELARQVGLTLIGRMRGQRFHCLSGAERMIFDADPTAVGEEDRKHQRKGAGSET